MSNDLDVYVSFRSAFSKSVTHTLGLFTTQHIQHVSTHLNYEAYMLQAYNAYRKVKIAGKGIWESEIKNDIIDVPALETPPPQRQHKNALPNTKRSGCATRNGTAPPVTKFRSGFLPYPGTSSLTTHLTYATARRMPTVHGELLRRTNRTRWYDQWDDDSANDSEW